MDYLKRSALFNFSLAIVPALALMPASRDLRRRFQKAGTQAASAAN